MRGRRGAYVEAGFRGRQQVLGGGDPFVRDATSKGRGEEWLLRAVLQMKLRTAGRWAGGCCYQQGEGDVQVGDTVLKYFSQGSGCWCPLRTEYSTRG